MPDDEREVSEAELAEGLRKFNAIISDYVRKGDFLRYLTMFGGHERPAAFFAIRDQIKSDRLYWQCVREAWWNLETSLPDKRKWLKCYRSTRPSREALMTMAERRRLEVLPASFPVYRGIGSPLAVNGLSWTLSRTVAERFAAYAVGSRRKDFGLAASEPAVVSGRCSKRDVLALYLDRKEQELVISPSAVRGKRLHRL